MVPQHGTFSLHTMLEGPWLHKTAFPTPMVRPLDESQGSSPLQGHGSWLMCEMALNTTYFTNLVNQRKETIFRFWIHHLWQYMISSDWNWTPCNINLWTLKAHWFEGETIQAPQNWICNITSNLESQITMENVGCLNLAGIAIRLQQNLCYSLANYNKIC